jgi:hypothetical protein
MGDGANFGVEQEHFPKDDLMWWPDVTMLTCHEKRGDTCHLETRDDMPKGDWNECQMSSPDGCQVS